MDQVTSQVFPLEEVWLEIAINSPTPATEILAMLRDIKVIVKGGSLEISLNADQLLRQRRPGGTLERASRF
jgi:hypothetical protein